MIELVLPYPVSANRYWRAVTLPNRQMMVPTKEAIDYRKAWDDDVRCIDLGNAEKVLSDALQGIVFEDDRWIWDLHKRRKEPDGDGRVVLRVAPLVQQAEPQASLL